MPPRRAEPRTSELRTSARPLPGTGLAYPATSQDAVPFYTGDQVPMKNATTPTKKKSDVSAFSDAAKAVVDKMVARTPVVKVPSSHRLSK